MGPGPVPRGRVAEHLVLLALVASLAGGHILGLTLTSGTYGPLVQGDARAYFAYLPSLILDADLDLTNQFEQLRPEEGDPGYPYGEGRNGAAANPFPAVPALLWLPGYVVGVVADGLVGVVGWGATPIGYGPAAVWAAVVWCLILVGVGAELTRRVVEETIDRRPALGAVVMIWLGTSALYYTLITPLYSHAIAWFAVAAMLWLAWEAAKTSSRPRPWLWTGIASGVVVAIRLQDLPLVVLPAAALVALARQSQEPRSFVRPVLAWIAGLSIGYLPQAVVGYAVNGSLAPLRGIDPPSAPSLSKLAAILLSTGYQGWMSWTPLVLPALVGVVLLVRGGRTHLIRTVAAGGLIAITGMLLIDLLHPYGAGAAFGGRRYVSATPLLALGLARILAGRPKGELPRAPHPNLSTVGPQLPGSASDLRAVLRQLAAWLDPEPRAARLRWLGLTLLTAWAVLVLVSYELLVIRHGVYPTLGQTVRHLVGLGAP